MMRVTIAGIGVIAPGFDDWGEAAPVLAGTAPYAERPIQLAAPAILHERERRRTSQQIRLALNVARQAVEDAGMEPGDLAAVFGSGNGDGAILHALLGTLADPAGMVSPTHFHNSVHNAAVGYWSIGTGTRQPCTSIGCHDFTFAAALLKAALQVTCENRPVLLAVFDIPFPEPLNSARPLAGPFGVALVLTPPAAAGRSLEMDWRPGRPAETALATAALERLWSGNPAARALPLLEALAAPRAAAIDLLYPEDGSLHLELAP